MHKDFVEETYLQWAKANMRSWQIDTSRLKPIRDFFGKKKLGEIRLFLIESFKIKRMKAEIVYKRSSKPRTPASVNRKELWKLFNPPSIPPESDCHNFATSKKGRGL